MKPVTFTNILDADPALPFADGYLGLLPKISDVDSPTPFIQFLKDFKLIDNLVFSVYLSNNPVNTGS